MKVARVPPKKPLRTTSGTRTTAENHCYKAYKKKIQKIFVSCKLKKTS